MVEDISEILVEQAIKAHCLSRNVVIETGAVKKFAAAIGDNNPLWIDEEYAKNTAYHGTIVPPHLFFIAELTGLSLKDNMVPMGTGGVDGGCEIEFFKPVRIGDTINVVAQLKVVRERRGKLGRLFFVDIETTCKNQLGHLIALIHNTMIYYKN